MPFDHHDSGTEGGDNAFLTDVRTFMSSALTPDLRAAGRRTFGVHSEIDACRIWHKRLHERGWIAPAWPREFGGTGWTARERFLFERECAANDAPVLFATGIRSLGPLLIEEGNEAQRARYLPAILSGDDLWCQGFSEPGAGSDLANVQTHAVRRGDRYIINGSKIWTTGAHLANRMFAIVRTARDDRRQVGLTFLLIDMDSPGLRVRPILDLTGAHEFNEVFFEDVEAPADNRVGEENDGWRVAKRLMQMARSNNTPSAHIRRTLRHAAHAAQAAGLSDDAAIVHRLTGLHIELQAYAQLELASLPRGRPDADATAVPSMLKLLGTELQQRATALALEICAPHGAVAAGNATSDDPSAEAATKYFATRAATIYSGTSETHRNILARHLLGRTGDA